MDPQQRLRALATHRRQLLRAPVIDLDQLGEVERSIAHLIVRIEQDRLIGAK